MQFSYLLLFSIVLFINHFLLKIFGKKYALDKPDYRKKHKKDVSQIGGLIFGPILLLLCWFFDLTPLWYIIGGFISIILGSADDVFSLSWKTKLLVQLILLSYLSYIFWGHFNIIIFYNHLIYVEPIMLFIFFLIWFVGIFNAINLLDGLDGLAGGFAFIVSVGLIFSGNTNFSNLNIIFSIIILGFLIYNQRPAKLFMGDAGSLFLGFHFAVLPLLFSEYESPNSTTLLMTPFVLISSYLIADTARVFFTRIASKKSPMTADTIHFHHLLLQNSGSYLSSIAFIYLVTSLSVIIAIMSFEAKLNSNMIYYHLSFLLLFILTPPIKTYVPQIVKIIKPFYSWQKSDLVLSPYIFRTLFILLLQVLLISSYYYYNETNIIIFSQKTLGILLICIFIVINRNKMISIYTIQLGLIFLLFNMYWNYDFGIVSKLLSIIINVSYLVFFLEKRSGCKISSFSAIDLLIILLIIGGIALYSSGIQISIWFIHNCFSIWFGTSFIFRRTITRSLFE